MREEPQPDLRGAALDEFLSDAVKLPDQYGAMLATLRHQGTKLFATRGLGRGFKTSNKNFLTSIFACSGRQKHT